MNPTVPPATSKRMVLVTIILMDILTGMEFDLFIPSFPELQSLFGLTPFWVEALLSANFAGYCLSLFLVGSLADQYGRKPIILMGLLTFIIGSFICLWIPSYPFMLAGRLIQGIGIAAPAILSFLIIADTYSLKKQQSLFAILNGLFNLSAGAAPVIGSSITLHFHWQGNFMTLFILGVISFVMAMVYIPSNKLPEHKEPFSLHGYTTLFQSKSLLLLMVFFVLNFVPYWVFVGMSPLLYMEDLDVSLSHFGYYQGTLALVFALGSLLFGRMIARYDQKTLLTFASQIFILSLISLTLVTLLDSPNPLYITLAFLLFIIGQIIPGNLLYPVCLSVIPGAKGRISAILQGGRLIFSSICLQVAGYIYQGSFRNIGIILIFFILMTVIALFAVMKNRELMEFSQKS